MIFEYDGPVLDANNNLVLSRYETVVLARNSKEAKTRLNYQFKFFRGNTNSDMTHYIFPDEYLKDYE